MTKKVLFVCIHNSARSQMAEAFINQYGKGEYIAESAGIEPGKMNPFVVKAMQEIGIDLSANSCNAVSEFLPRAEEFDYVVTVCDEASAEKCPVFPGNVKRLHWGFEDPSGLAGSDEEKLQRTREIRDQIKEKVVTWLENYCG